MGPERWFDRKATDLRGRVKNHLVRVHFSVGSDRIRVRASPRRRLSMAAALELRMPGKAGENVEGRRMSFFGIFDLPFGLKGQCGTFLGVLSAGPKCFGGLRFCFLHIKQIAASGVRCDHEGENTAGKKEAISRAPNRCSRNSLMCEN